MVGTNRAAAQAVASAVSRRLNKHGLRPQHASSGRGRGLFVTRNTLLMGMVGADIDIYQRSRTHLEEIRDRVVEVLEGWREYEVGQIKDHTDLYGLWTVKITVKIKEK